MRRTFFPLIASAALLAGLVPAVARADLDVDVRNGDRVVATIEPAGEVETFRFELPAGAALKVTAKGRRTRSRPDAPRVRLRLLDRFDRDIPGEFLKNGRRSAKIRGFIAPVSGAYAVEVRGDGFRIGDYTLSIAWKSEKRHRFRRLDTSTGIQELDFAADAGADIAVTAKARRGSPSRPVVFQLLRLEGSDVSVVKTFTFPSAPGKRHDVAATIQKTGDHRLLVRDGGGVGGPTDVTLKIKSGRVRRDINATDGQIDPPPPGVSILSTIVVDAAGGRTEGDVPALVVPPSALSRLRVLQLGRGGEFGGPDGQGLLPAGDAIYVGPEAVEFARLVELTVPYDPATLPNGTSELRIVRLESTGLRSVLDPSSISFDEDAHSATTTIGRGGLYAAFRLVPPPRPTSVTPFTGHQFGGYAITLGGTGFRDARDENGDRYLEITLDGKVVRVEILSISPTLVSFTAPAHLPARVTWGVHDRETDLLGELPADSYWYQ